MRPAKSMLHKPHAIHNNRTTKSDTTLVSTARDMLIVRYITFTETCLMSQTCSQ